MIKAGGILGIIGGLFGILAAIATLFIGGLGSAFEANGASTVVGLGWGGIAFSLASIICGAIAFAKPKGGGIVLILVALGGMIGGGMLVALCMILSLAGGVLAIIGAKKLPSVGTDEPHIQPGSQTQLAGSKKVSPWIWASVATLGLLIVVGLLSGNKPSTPVAAPTAEVATDPLEQLAQAQASDIREDGQLAEMFKIGSAHTDLQRENALKEIKGKIVSWTLPVYEVKREGDGYKIQTRSNSRGDQVGAFVSITPRSQEDRQIIESLKTGDAVSFKGVISDSFMRNLIVKPAVLAHTVVAPEIQAPPQPDSDEQSAFESADFYGQLLLSKDQAYSVIVEDTPAGNHVAVYFRNNSVTAQTIAAACQDRLPCKVTGQYMAISIPESAPQLGAVTQSVELISIDSALAMKSQAGNSL